MAHRVARRRAGFFRKMGGTFKRFKRSRRMRIYESAVISGIALEITDHEEMIRALEIICRRHIPGIMDSFDNEIQKNITVLTRNYLKIE